MQLDKIRHIERKELALFFSSPVGYLFLASFLAVTLFVFFWGEAFFVRNIADVRPMFEWMPVLLVFLSAALTMRMWSEERRTGTLELVTTTPLSGWDFVLGKFLACWILLAIALALTLPLPITVSLVADLDWGPVLAGYLAALLLGGAYLAIGVFVSARTDSQIVSLILTSFACGVFYLIGSPLLTDLVGGGLADAFRSLGSGSRFESITRGVIDVRDLYYYTSILAVFLTLNVYALEAHRWAEDGDTQHHRGWLIGTGLLVGNLLLANFWLGQLTSLRVDVTQGRIYSISEATRGYLEQLQEPLLIRGYFSNKTHPLLAPLVPRMKDLLTEFGVAGGNRVRVEIIDPADDPAKEDEANTKYSIRPVPFQIADRYQARLVNSYFDVLVRYGDEYEVLGFRDLIEVKVVGEGDLDVQLRNPEYDLTRSIKKALYGFQGGNSIFANVHKPVSFVGYVSADEKLPEALVDFRSVLNGVLEELGSDGAGKFSAQLLDPEAGDGSIALEIAEKYGFQPMAASLFDSNRFYFYLTLGDGNSLVQIPIPEALSEEATRRGIEEGLKRFATGLLKTIAFVAPAAPPPYMGQQGMTSNQYMQLRDFLQSDFSVENTNLSEGVVPESADLLMVVDPEALDETQLFAVDQFLMKGGTVVLTAAPFSARLTQQSLLATNRSTGLETWLAHHGVVLLDKLVMDPQNAAFPAPVTRQVGGFTFQDLVMLDYPYFIDVRGVGLSEDTVITSGLPQITLTWGSPIEIDVELNAGRNVVELLRSSSGSWLSQSTDVMPRVDDFGVSGYAPEGETGSHLLGVLLEGRFDSYFAGKTSPLLATDEESEADEENSDVSEEVEKSSLGTLSSVIERSPESARLFLFASNDFLADQTLRMVGSADGTLYGNSVQMMANVVDWSLEDRNLLSIRSRGHFNRTLPPLDSGDQALIEYLNYGLALAGVGMVFFLYRRRIRSTRLKHESWLAGGVV
ncbi:MAG: Gldg family protein [Gammaproteobacteria bacterium]|nr:Gldg family protein [Gammaproteobacteria bacterium]